MEHIRQAVELAKSHGGVVTQPPPTAQVSPERHLGWSGGGNSAEFTTVALDPAHLESMRIVSHDVLDQRSKSFDMLRTQVVRTMEEQKWKLLAVTSPTPGCGKTVTAINLALSVARQPQKSVLLVDFDFLRPQLARSLGLKPNKGLLGVLEGRTTLSEAIVEARIGNNKVMVLPCETSTSHSSEWMASPEMRNVIQTIRKDFSSHIVILDMPPILPTDDVISILPQLDCVLLVAAVGVSTISDIERCTTHLQTAEVVRVVLNKSSEANTGYYY